MTHPSPDGGREGGGSAAPRFLALSPRLAAPGVRRVLDSLTRPAATGGTAVPARFVGGCVRDLLLGVAADDIDIATPLPPDEVMRRLAADGIRVIPTGIAHGTVTAVPTADEPVEITTLRRDVETFGRQARVAYTDDWLADAARRDFTFNALSLGPAGDLHDPFGGEADLAAGRVRFIGDARARIGEDVLRLLRYFRFLARFGRGGPDAATLAVCRDMAPSLRTLSGERVRMEVLKILGGPRPAWVWGLMVDTGVIQAVLPRLSDVPRLAALCRVAEQAPEAGDDPLPRLAALLPPPVDPATVAAVAASLRLSNAERERLRHLAAPTLAVHAGLPPAARRVALYRLGAGLYRDLLLLSLAGEVVEGGGADLRDLPLLLDEAVAWVAPVFPLRGADLLAAGLPPGPVVGRVLAAVEQWWQDHDFQPARAACLEEAIRRRAGMSA